MGKWKIIFFAVAIFGVGCTSHVIRFRGTHFATPVTGEHSWSGQISGVTAAPVEVILVDDIKTNPPTRSAVTVDTDVGFESLLMVMYIGANFQLTTFKSLDIIFEDDLPMLKWQFLNHGAKSGKWVASLQAGAGSRRQITTDTPAQATSTIKTTAGGISIGYLRSDVIPYFSYVNETYDVTTDITNSSGSFGPYSDKGTHEAYALGVTKNGNGFLWGAEYTYTIVKWDRGTGKDEAVGFKVGYGW